MSDRRARLGQLLLLALAAAVFVALRLEFNHEYKGAKWAALVAGTAKLPFGHRVLVPVLVSPWVQAGVSIRSAFAVTEWFATMAAVAGMAAALRTFISDKAALVASAAFVGVLGLLFSLQFRWPIFYPWDLPAIAAIVWAVAWARRRRHLALLILSAFAAANRESAIMLPAIVVVLALHDPDRRATAWRWASLMFVIIAAVRFSITIGWASNRGEAIHWHIDETWRVLNNLKWLSTPSHTLQILGAFCLLPIAWFVVRRFLPVEVRRLEWVWLAVMAGLLIVANVYEPRAFGEPITLAYLGVVVGVHRWLEGPSPRTPTPNTPPMWLVHLDRWTPATIVVVWAFAVLWFRIN